RAEAGGADSQRRRHPRSKRLGPGRGPGRGARTPAGSTRRVRDRDRRCVVLLRRFHHRARRARRGRGRSPREVSADWRERIANRRGRTRARDGSSAARVASNGRVPPIPAGHCRQSCAGGRGRGRLRRPPPRHRCRANKCVLGRRLDRFNRTVGGRLRLERDRRREAGSAGGVTVTEPSMSATDSAITTWFENHRAFLWGLSYRITGSAEDADDVVQDTFVRACRHAPAHLDNPRQWLMRIAINLGRDVLRRRKRRGYVGPWLPTLVETGDDDSPPSFEPAFDGQTLEARYDLLESASLAFLQALEALTPTQRAVLLLRDAFDYTAAEVAAVIDTTEGNVRIIHMRARRA